MRKSIFTKTICTSTALSFMMAISMTYTAHAYTLAPLSFSKMYNLAQNGEVESLRASVRRGMNIDVMNGNGDTGLCIAAKRRDSYTYNVFRAAGANPRHPCTINISDYDDFLNSSNAAPISSTSRQAYSTIGKESFSFSPNTWWTLGGLALVGGVTAVALSGGGGGGDSNSNTHFEEYNSLGSIAISKTGPKRSTSGTALNTTTITVTNNNDSQISSIDLSSGVLKNTEFLKSGVLAKDGGSFINTENGIIDLASGTIGMIAVGEDSSVINDGYIKADVNNASVAMISSEKSTSVNNSKGVLSSSGNALGIDLTFSGTDSKNTYTLIGMYADTNSMAINNGDIRGTATKATLVSQNGESSNNSGNGGGSGGNIIDNIGNLLGTSDEISTGTSVTSSISGKIIGMEAMILNSGNDVKGDEIKIVNSSTGKIDISAGDGGTDTSIQISAFGMSSFLDDAFLNGSKNINRAEVVTIENSGKINLGYTGKYSTPSSTTLRKGTGGIVGIRADANTTATNTSSGSINLTFAEYGSSGAGGDDDAGSSTQYIGAGMQSLHGANLTNDGFITIKTTASNAITNYGMLSVEGSGTISGLYTNMKQVLNNNGIISVEASNSYGMASYNGGTLNNNSGGAIVLGSSFVSSDTTYTNNIGLYGSGDGTIVSLNNYGTIDIYSNNSIAMKNDYSGGQTLTNNNTINIHRSATGSSVFGGYYSVAVNNGIINYDTTTDGTPSENGTATDPFSNYTLTISTSVMTTKSDYSKTSTTEEIYNNTNKQINVNGSSFTSAMSVETTQGRAVNNGYIYINRYIYDAESNSAGMYLDSNTSNFATILNNGTITTESYMSAAMASDTTNNAAMINSGTINTYKEYSLGLYASGKSTIQNSGNINIKKSNSSAIYTVGNSNITNSGNITISKSSSDTEKLKNVVGIYSKGSNNTITNSGSISVSNDEETLSFGIYLAEGENTTIINSENATIYNANGHAIEVAENVSDTKITNYGTIETYVGNGIDIAGSGATVENYGTIISNNNNGINITSNATVTNFGTITSLRGYGIYVNGGENMEGSITVTNKGTINASTYGIYVIASGTSEEQKTTVINEGTINAGTGIYIQTESSDAYVSVEGNSASVYDFRNYEKPLEQDETFEANISVEGTPHHGPYYASYETADIDTSSALTFVNNGIYSANSINFNNRLISYVLGAGGSYQASVLQGTVALDPTIVAEGNDTTYTIENAFVGADNGIRLASNLYMFDSTLHTNSYGNLDAVLTMKKMDTLVSNKSLADYLSNNYLQDNTQNIFNAMKTTESKSDFDSFIKNKFGLGFIPNLAKQSLDIEKTVGQEINSDVLQPTDEQSRTQFNLLSYKNKMAAKHEVDGYEDKIIAAYGFKDESLGRASRLGFGLAAVRSDSSFDDGSSRYNNMLEAFVPVTNLLSDNTAVMVKPKAGFARGHYRRTDADVYHKADTKEYYLGADVNVTHSYNLDVATIEPIIGFSLTDMYLEDADENNNGLQIGSRNVVSAQSLLGADIKKEFELNSNHKFALSTGAKYYHEFGNKYRPSVSRRDMTGHYELASNRLQRDFGLLNLKATYQYKTLSLGSALYIPIEQKHKKYYMLNLEYAF